MERWQIDMIEGLTIVYAFPFIFAMVVISCLVKAITTKTLLKICGVMLVVGGGMSYDLLRDQEVRSSVALSGYRVDFVEGAGVIEHNRYFEIVRADGKRVNFPIDGDANKCEDFHVTREEEKVYFHCSGDQSADYVSYIDTKSMMLYGGFMKESQQIDELKFN